MSDSERKTNPDTPVIGPQTKPSQMSDPGFASLLSEIIPVISFMRRWWWLAILMVTLSSLTTAVLVVIRGVEYQVGASLYYKLGTELAPPPTMGKDPLVITRRSEDVNNEIEILTSPDLLRKVVEDLGEAFFTPKPPTTAFGQFKRKLQGPLNYVMNSIEEALIQAGLRQRLTILQKAELGIASKLKVELVRESDVIAITLDISAPDAGETIVANLISAYQERHLQVHQAVAVKEFLTRETQQLRQQLDASTQEILDFQQKNDLWSSTEQQKMLLDNRKALQTQVAGTEGHLAHLAQSVTHLKQSVIEQPEEVQLSSGQQLNPAIVDTEDRLASLTMSRAVVETAYRSGSREAMDKQTQADALEKRIKLAPALVPYVRSMGINMVRQELLKELLLKEADFNGMTDQLAVEQKQLDKTIQASQVLGEAIAKFQHLEREHRLLEGKYGLYNENFEKADIASVMNLSQISNMELISPPVASLEPVRPRLTIVAAAAIFSGLTLAFVIALAYDLRGLLCSRKVAT